MQRFTKDLLSASCKLGRSIAYHEIRLIFLVGVAAAMLASATPAQAQNLKSSSCWEMTSSKPFSGGKPAHGFKWRLLGGCTVTVQTDGLPSALWITETKETIPITNFTWLKPYQNPTGMTLAGSWMNSTGTRAIFAIKTW
jgi:hypothetical protein